MKSLLRRSSWPRLPLINLSLLLFAGSMLSVTRAPDRQPGATYMQGSLSVTLPYHSSRAGSGRLVTEILDPENHVLGRSERSIQVSEGDGFWRQTIAPEKHIAFEDIIWQRVRYRFEFEDARSAAIEGVESISQILRRPIVHIIGQKEYFAGSQAAVRVIVSDACHNDIAETGNLSIELLVPNQKSLALFSGHLNQRGTVEAQFHFPAGLMGNYEMRYVADTPAGSSEYLQPIQLADRSSILLTTEKPIYQPGQTIHVRALALDRYDHKAEEARALTFEIEDPRGNKVFKSATATDKFGVASTQFSLADEVNLGAYHLRALMGDASSPSNTAEIALDVERYVLPKFKVSVEFSKKDSRPRRDYRPGDHVIGVVRANYFFGKPVDHAEITVKASGMDVQVFEAATSAGKTDSDGAYHFDLKLPDFFAGRPLNQGAAGALIAATVKDSAAHSETRNEPITISQSSLLITAVPEGGTLIPHLDNEIFVLTSYPDGTPARTNLTAHLPGARDQEVATDRGGVAVIHVSPGAESESLRVEADDHRGNRASTDVPLQMKDGEDQILLRTSRAVLEPGDAIDLNVFSTRGHGPVYVDIVKNGQTVLTRDLDVQNGRADLRIAATPEMAGTLDIDAYMFGQNGQPVADHRLVFIQPAEDLKIQTTADAAVYKPGSDARIHLHVTNSHGQGVSAALGVQVVDEAVFALAEKQPGFAKVFFYLEQEVMKPRYEIHSVSMERAIEPIDITGKGQQDLDASALFAATEMATPTKLDTEFGRSLPHDKFRDYQQRYQAAFREQVRRIAAKLSGNVETRSGGGDIVAAFALVTIDGSRPRDAWNSPLRIEPAGWYHGEDHYYRIRSAGPDQKFNTADDLTSYVETRSGKTVNQPGQTSWLDLKVEQDRGPLNGRAEVAGTVVDPSGAFVSDATVRLHRASPVSSREARTDAGGKFNFSALPAGDYQIVISAPGFTTLNRDFSIRPRERAVLSATLLIGETSEVVEVTMMAKPMALAMTRASVAAVTGAMRFQSPESSRLFATVRKAADPVSTHVRSYFPEALYINPEIITDASGDASISIPIADSITTWRMAILASTRSGALGTGSGSIKVFQDFFVDLDLPVTLTQGDQVSIPIAAYNYSGKPGDVHLKIEPEDWFTLDDSPDRTVAVESGRVGASQFTLTANRIGKFKLTLSARMDPAAGDEKRQDIVVREIEVIPNGREQNLVFNGRLDGSAQHELRFPANSIPDATSIFVRLYPGPLSQVIEGMDSILTMPGGCFEQTSSSTYPNVLALDYMKRTKKVTPEVHAKAEGYIANGYQRLLTFEAPGGGFSWFGQAPANKILTAYGLMEFNDMSKVADVDPRLIERTRDWLAGQQQPDGSWKPDTSFINEGATNRYNSDVLRITAYIAWSLANTGYEGPVLEKAKQFIESHSGSKSDAYTLAVTANFAAEYGKDREFTRQSMEALLDARTESGDLVSWSAEETGVYSTGASAAIETTGLAAQALLKWGHASGTARKALNFISSKKQASGAWGTTQATIMALRSLLLASQLSATDVRGSVQVFLNGKHVKTLDLAPANNDLLHQFVFKGVDARKPAVVQMKFEGQGGLAYQVAGRYFTPWDQKPPAEPLSIEIAYDRTKLARNDIATATATIRNNLEKTAKMVMVDLGIPPGFDLLSEDLQSFQEATAAGQGQTGEKTGLLEKFSLTATQAILYFNALSPGQTVTLKFRLHAKYPIRARAFASRVYEYYDPEVKATARPVRLEVTER